MAGSSTRIPVGVSSCLLGQEVRFDGGHKRDRFLTDLLGDYVDWVPICPELEAGLGVPREPFRLTRDGADESERFVGSRSESDATELMESATASLLAVLASQRLRGFVLKKGSPSCGIQSVRIYENGIPAVRKGAGIFGRRLLEQFPLLPVEEEGRLNDPRIRENFIGRIYTYDRWMRFKESCRDGGGLVRFHTEHKMLILAHAPHIAKRLGQLVARVGRVDLAGALDEYEEDLMLALRSVASRGRHTNVLQHLSGFLKNELAATDRGELSDVIEQYRVGRVPLAVPLVLLYHHFKHLRDDWVDCQTYLQPYPAELALRSSI